MNLAEEFALLAYDDDGSPTIEGTRVDNGLAGALLLELALAGRIDVADKRVVMADGSPTGDPLIDRALSAIAADKQRKAKDWVGKLAKTARDDVMASLVAQGVVRPEKDKVLLVFPRTRYPAAGGVEPPAETDARQRMTAAVAGTGAVDARTAALCSLVAATGMERKVFRDLDRKQVKARLKEIGEGAWAADAVKKHLEEVQAAIMVAIVSSNSSGGDGGGGDGGGGGGS